MIQAGASWCGPCQMLKPMLTEEVIKRDGAIEYLYIDIDEQKEIAQSLKVSVL